MIDQNVANIFILDSPFISFGQTQQSVNLHMTMVQALVIVDIVLLLSYPFLFVVALFFQLNDAMRIIFPISVGSSPQGCVGVQPQANQAHELLLPTVSQQLCTLNESPAKKNKKV